MKRTTFEQSYETQQLIATLAGVTGFISYSDLSKACGQDVRGKAAAALASARRILRSPSRGFQMEFGTVRGMGLQRSYGIQCVKAAQQSQSKINKEAKRGIERLACADFDSLSNEEKIEHTTTASVLGVLHAFTKEKSTDRIRGAVAASSDKLSIGQTLKAFGASES